MDTATTEIYTYWHTLSLTDSLPIFWVLSASRPAASSNSASPISRMAIIMALSARLAPTIECDRRAAERRHAGRSRHRATADHATSIAPGPLSSSDRRGIGRAHV